MPTLVSNGAVIEDEWTFCEDAPDTVAPRMIVPISAIGDTAGIEPVGVWIKGDADAETVAPLVKTAALVAIRFPGFADGRGLSLATLLRTRYGYTGELRAIGEVLPDFTPYMRRSGFDSFQLTSKHQAEVAIACMARITDYYQASVVEPKPAFRRS